MRSSSALATAGLISLAASQNTTVGTYTIDPSSVDPTTKRNWCDSQTAACPLICLQTAGNNANTITNACDADNLEYSCICSNGISPNASEYSQTMPYFICTEWGTQCVSDCGTNSSCADACRTDHLCGAQNPTRVNSTVSSTMSKTATSLAAGATTNTYTSIERTAATSTASSGANTGVSEPGQSFGLMVLVTSLVGGLAFLI